jgi:hypothetical protein
LQSSASCRRDLAFLAGGKIDGFPSGLSALYSGGRLPATQSREHFTRLRRARALLLQGFWPRRASSRLAASLLSALFPASRQEPESHARSLVAGAPVETLHRRWRTCALLGQGLRPRASFESPRSISAVCALLYPSIESGVARRLSPGWRSRHASPAQAGLRSTSDLIGQKLQVASLHYGSSRSPLSFDRGWSHRYDAPVPQACGLETFETPRWLSPVCALLHLSMEAGVTVTMLPSHRLAAWRHRDASLALASLRSPPSLDGGWSHVAVLPSHRLAACGHRDASLALTSLRSPLPFDRGWSHVAVLRSYSARRLAEPQDHKSLAAISPERTQVLPLGTL